MAVLLSYFEYVSHFIPAVIFTRHPHTSMCSYISPFLVYPPVLPNLVGFAPLGQAQNQMVLEGLKVLTGTVSDLCLSGCELPRVLLKTSGPVVHVCLCIVQLTFGISVLQFSGDNLPNDARHLMLHKTLTPQAYTCVGLSVYPCT